MEQNGISIISPTTTDSPAGCGKTNNCNLTQITMPMGNKVYSEAQQLKEKKSCFQRLLVAGNSWYDEALSALAELVGTAILVLLGCMGCVGSLGAVPESLQISLTFGFAVTVVIQTIGHISGAHINPAITIGSVVLGKKSIIGAAIYIVAQILGAIIGYGLLKVVTPQHLLFQTNPNTTDALCVTTVNENVSGMQGLIVEGLSTAILMLLACGVWDSRNEKNTDSAAIKFGLGVAVLAMTAGPYTGCSMNPARSLAPAIWNNNWTSHWVYWLGPIGGSLLASFFYKTVFGPKKEKKVDQPETVALNSIIDSQKPEQN